MLHPNGMKESEYNNYYEYNNCIICHRNPEHFFKKYQSFGISKSELQNFNKNIKHVIIIYNRKNSESPIYYISEIEKWHNGLTWNNILQNEKPDIQKHVQIKEMIMYNNFEDLRNEINKISKHDIQ